MRNIAKFKKSAVLLILQNLWLDTLVFLSLHLVAVSNQIQYTAVQCKFMSLCTYFTYALCAQIENF